MPGEELRGPGTDWSRHPGVGGDTTAVSGLQGQTWLRSQMCRSLRRRGWGLEKAPKACKTPVTAAGQAQRERPCQGPAPSEAASPGRGGPPLGACESVSIGTQGACHPGH